MNFSELQRFPKFNSKQQWQAVRASPAHAVILATLFGSSLLLNGCDVFQLSNADRTNGSNLLTARDTPPLEGVEPISLLEAEAILGPIFGNERQQCTGCHYDWSDRLKSWATSTLNQAERNRSLFTTAKESGVDQLIANPESLSGIFKAYPEYYQEYFETVGKAEAFKEFAVKSQPGGTGGLMAFQTERFSNEMKQNGAEAWPFDNARAQSDFTLAYETLLRIAKATSLESSTQCVSQVTEDFKIHLEEMKVAGLQNLYKKNQFYGCAIPGNTGAECFPGPNAAGTAEVVLEGITLAHRVIQVLEVGETSFWTRSSMDGRFVANGSNPGKIQDMEKKIQWNVEGTSYDPSFIPNGSGLTFHGEGAIFCTMETITRELSEEELLNKIIVNGEEWILAKLDPSTSENCIHGDMTNSISTYQSVGSAIGLGKTYVVTGSHVTDGGHSSNGSNLAFSGTLDLFEIDKTPKSFGKVKTVSQFQLPGEGDYSLSPSSNYVVGRLAGRSGEAEQSVQLGYRMRSLKEMIATVNRADGTNTFQAGASSPTTTICFQGAGSKPMMSLDERFLAFHQYEENGSANIYLVDLLGVNPKPIRITNFSNNERALFAHFRADGWLYFLVKGIGESDKLYASNLAVILGNSLH